MRLANYSPDVVVAVYAHPDDADVAAGGTLALFAKRGGTVHLIVTCDGAKGSHSPQQSGVVIAETRRRELERAADLMGVAAVHQLGYPDGEIENTVVLRAQLVALLRSIRPSLVIGPDPTATFFGGVYVNHRDHRETGWALLDAVAPAVAMPLYFPDAGPAHAVETLLLSGTHEPDVAIDVREGIDAKVAAVMAHTSQMGGDEEGIAHVVRSRATQAGHPVGVAYAEAFRCVELGG